MAAAMEVSDVKVQGVGGGLPAHAKLAHILATVVSGVIAVAVATVLADGTSVIRLRDPIELPIATNPALKSKGLSYRLDELLGPTYGIGLHHDQSGHSWYQAGAGSTLKEIIANLGVEATIAAVPYVISTDDLKHPVPFLSCDALKMTGLAAMWFGFIAEAVAVVMVIFHSLATADLLPRGIVKPVGSLIWLVVTAGFLIVISLACGIYTATWACDNPVIPSIVISDHFTWNYGFPFAIIGFISALLVLLVSLVFGSATAPTAGTPKVVGGLLFGVLVALVTAFIVTGATGAYDAKPDADPNVNPCEGKKPKNAGPGDHYFSNVDCMRDSLVQTLEQAGGNVTKGFRGGLDAGDRVPITDRYDQTDLCPVNVHWHLGAEHLSVGQFDEKGHGPHHRRELAADARLGFQCHHYDANDTKFTTPFNWT